jgi:hypothetical protein
MKLYVRAKPKSKKEFIKQIDETHFIVSVHSPPEDGRANEAIRKSLADFLHISKSSLVMISNTKTKEKIFERI